MHSRFLPQLLVGFTVFCLSALAESPIDLARGNKRSLESQIGKMDGEIAKIKKQIDNARANQIVGVLGAATNDDDAKNTGYGGMADESELKKTLRAAIDYKKGLKGELKQLNKAIQKWENNNDARNNGLDAAKNAARDAARDHGREAGREGAEAAKESGKDSGHESGKNAAKEACPDGHMH